MVTLSKFVSLSKTPQCDQQHLSHHQGEPGNLNLYNPLSGQFSDASSSYFLGQPGFSPSSSEHTSLLGLLLRLLVFHFASTAVSAFALPTVADGLHGLSAS